MKKNYFAFLALLFCMLTATQGVFSVDLNQTMYFDFGPSSGRGVITSNPVNGTYWNNIVNTQDGLTMTPLNSYDLVNSLNASTGYQLEITKAFKTNTGGEGGLTSPSTELLDDLAVATATQDYFYVENSNAKFKIKNLDANRRYKFYLFGTRSTSETRITKFIITGESAVEGTHQTSGINGGGNIANLYITELITPDSNGEIHLEMLNATSSFGYLNAMKLEEYTTGPIIRAESITLSGQDITESGQTSQILATVLPEGATYPSIVWEVDDTSVARIDNKGMLYPKTNGKVTVTASIIYNDETLNDELEINISGQLGNVYFKGTASEDTEDIEMHMLTDQQGTITNNFEIYTSLKGSGSFTFYRDRGNGNKIEYGQGASAGTLAENGAPITTTVQGPVRISINLSNSTYTVLPISSLCLVGNSVGTTDVSKGAALEYKGKGVWSAPISFNGGTGNQFNFIINKTSQECLKRITGTNQIILQSQGTLYNIQMQDIRTNMNGGEFDVIVDLRNYTYAVSCGEVNDYKISYMGSSVCSGAGAIDNKGYAYMYTNLLKQRYEQGLGLEWVTSNVSIGGNTTANLLDRWERDLLSDCSRYVIYGLSLGNEGIHERGEPAYISYRDGMLQAIKQAEDAGIVPVIANNYTRGDFNATDYNYVKQLNLLIHEWDLPSINTLGAIDNGAGKWANGYENDNAHQNTAGHEEFFYAMVPSLFDALEAGKPFPQRDGGTAYTLGKNISTDCIEFIPENIVHPFTISFDIKTTGTGIIASFENETGNGFLKIDDEGKVIYESPKNRTILSSVSVNDGTWKRITLTHYYAWGITMLYVDKNKAGEVYEKLVPKKFALSNAQAPAQIDFRELFFWRAGMTPEEINYVCDGKMMKSSLEIYAPLGAAEPLQNLAQSTNTLKLANSSFVAEQNIYIDFGPDTSLGEITASPDANGNYWNNVVGNSTFDLKTSDNFETAYQLEVTKNFKINPDAQGGLTEPDAQLLGDLAVATATKDYFYVENGNATFKIKNLNKNKAYRFYLFGSRLGTSDTDLRRSKYIFTGTTQSEGILQTTGEGKVQNTANLFVSAAVYPDANGEINFEMINSTSSFGYLNAMKIEECNAVYPEGASPLISATPADALGVRIARVHSSSGSFNSNEATENLLLDKTIPANKTKKWCNASGADWVIIELSDYYDIDRFFIEDCRTREPGNPNVPEYSIYVSTTGTADADWTEVVHEANQENVMYKSVSINPVKARYVKFVPKGIATIRIYNFEIYGRKSFESLYDETGLISVGKPVVDQASSPNIQQGAVALFDGNLTANNSKWVTSTGNKYVVVDLEDNYAISEFKIYDARSAGGNDQNIDGYKISISSDLSAWDVVADVTGKSEENIKTETLASAKTGRYVKLEIPENRMGSQKKISLYEFNIYGTLVAAADDARLASINIPVGVLSPAFDMEHTAYTVNLDKEVESIKIQALPRNANATITGDIGEQSLSYGKNEFYITVTAEDGVAKKIYKITVNRAEKSAITGIKSLSIENMEFFPAFTPSTFDYRMESGTNRITVLAETVNPYVKIEGAGERILEDGANYLVIKATSEDGVNSLSYNLTVYYTKNLISVSSPDGKGKRIVNIDSYSGMTGAHENPFRLLRGWKENLKGDNTMKWCDTSESPWVIFSLADIYTINHVEFRDCKMIEGWPNIPQYSVYVSTTDTLEGSWTEIVNEKGVGGLNEKVKSFDPVDARFVKFVPSKGDGAIRIYGFDIYGTFKETIDREDVISVGKTVLNSSSFTNDMLTPANVLDGRSGTAWEFGKSDAFVEIDLEENYNIGKVVLADASGTIAGYKVSTSNTGNGTDWETVAEPTFENKSIERKEVLFPVIENVRYVRLDIPGANLSNTNRIKELEIHKGIPDTGVEMNLDGIILLYPNPVERGQSFTLNGVGTVSIYSLSGALLYTQDAAGTTSISTNRLEQGSYIVQLKNKEGIKQTKLIVR